MPQVNLEQIEKPRQEKPFEKKGNVRFQSRGAGSVHWKGGLPRCIDCGKQLSRYGRVRCFSCYIIARKSIIPVSEETKKKISETLKRIGHKPPSNIGRKHTEQTRKNMSEAKKGKVSSRKGVPQLHKRGENAPNWKGGITPLNKLIRKSVKYIKWRKTIFERDIYRCQMCFVRGKNLHVNHIIKFSIIKKRNNVKTFKDAMNCQELWNTNNGITLCKSCHINKVTHYEDYWESYFNLNLCLRGFIKDDRIWSPV